MDDKPTVIIGAGLQGLATANALLDRGESVLILEKEEDTGRATSFANAGMLTPSQSTPWNSPSDIHKIPKKEYAKMMSDASITDTKSIVDLIRNRRFYCVFGDKKIVNRYNDIRLSKMLLFLAGVHQKAYRFLRNIKRTFGLNVSPKLVKMIKLK